MDMLAYKNICLKLVKTLGAIMEKQKCSQGLKKLNICETRILVKT